MYSLHRPDHQETAGDPCHQGAAYTRDIFGEAFWAPEWLPLLLRHSDLWYIKETQALPLVMSVILQSHTQYIVSLS